MASKKGRCLAVLSMTITLFTYLLSVTWNSSPFIDVWPLEGILWETIATIIIIVMLSWILFQSRASIIVPLITLAFLVVVIPVLKYPNALSIIGPWDSTAHFSFAKWIIVNGHVDTAGNLYYSDQYCFRPGNSIIPATLSLVSSISLGWSMNTVLVAIYSAFMLLLLTTLKTVEHYMNEDSDIVKALWLVAAFTLAINLPVYYGGVELSYVYAAGILYIIVKWLSGNEATLIRIVLTALLIFTGLILTHLSTAVIVVAYILIVVTTLLITGSLGRIPKSERSYRVLTLLAVLVVSIFITYEIYVDVILFSKTLEGALHRIYSLYIRELEVASKAEEATYVTLAHRLL